MGIVGVLVVSIGVAGDGGGVVVSVRVLPTSVSGEPPAVPGLGLAVVVTVVSAKAEVANGPTRPAAVNPLPARAERIARVARRRARVRIGGVADR